MVAMPYLHDIRVFDGRGVHVVGHVVAADESGLDILADQAFENGLELRFMLDDVASFKPGGKVSFAATCDYCDPDDEVLDLYHVHLRFTRLSPRASEVAHLLV